QERTKRAHEDVGAAQVELPAIDLAAAPRLPQPQADVDHANGRERAPPHQHRRRDVHAALYDIQGLMRCQGALRIGVACVLFAALPATAFAGGFHISTIGLRRSAMTPNIANPDDVPALFHNPAGLADLPGYQTQLSLGLAFLDSTM